MLEPQGSDDIDALLADDLEDGGGGGAAPRPGGA